MFEIMKHKPAVQSRPATSRDEVWPDGGAHAASELSATHKDQNGAGEEELPFWFRLTRSTPSRRHVRNNGGPAI